MFKYIIYEIDTFPSILSTTDLGIDSSAGLLSIVIGYSFSNASLMKTFLLNGLVY